jgi:formate hydrogenlyase subunit 4
MLLLQVAAIVLFAPLLHGAMKRLRARLSGRPGPAAIQPYRDLAKLWHKEALLPDGASPLATVAPGLVLGVALAFVAALPLIARGGTNVIGDIVAIALLLALGRFVLTLAALDTRSAFAGMAASREVTFGALAEPAMLLALFGAHAVGTGTQLSGLLLVPFGPAGVLAFAAFALVTLAETARIPVDNQETHYELTMIHEGMLLEYGGWQLALLQLAAYVKSAGFLVLAAMILPGHTWWEIVGWVAVIAVAITFVETLLAKLRLFEVPQLLASAVILAAMSLGVRVLGGVG